jgi:hypothetical protein
MCRSYISSPPLSHHSCVVGLLFIIGNSNFAAAKNFDLSFSRRRAFNGMNKPTFTLISFELRQSHQRIWSSNLICGINPCFRGINLHGKVNGLLHVL